jgi:preprotein translocase subunit YajC
LGLTRRTFEEEISGVMNDISILAAAAGSSAGASFFIQTIPLVLVFVIFWFLLIRPQQKRMKDHQAQIAAVKKGDRVVTGGGLIGKVTKVTDSEVEVELGQGIRVTAVKSTLTQVIDPTAAKPAND